MMGQPAFLPRCLCDDCHIRVKIGQVKEHAPGTYNKFMDDGSVLLCSWWGANVACTKGEEKMAFYRAAVKNKGTELAMKDTVTCICADCGTQAWSSGLGLLCFNVGPQFERMEAGAKTTMPRVPAAMLAIYCPLTGVEKPAGAANYMTCSFVCKFLPAMCCYCCMPGRGKQPFTQFCKAGATEFCGKPIEYVSIETIKALPFPVPKASAQQAMGWTE
jgi:hypothetical protein